MINEAICRKINLVLETSGPRRHVDRVKVQELIGFLNREAPKTHFLFHFDELGVFDGLNASVAQTLMYRVWTEQLRDHLHFYILSGRSSYLHLIGKGHMKGRR